MDGDWHHESCIEDCNGWRGRGCGAISANISLGILTFFKDTHRAFWSNWHLQSWLKNIGVSDIMMILHYVEFDQPSKLGATHATNKQKIWFFLKFSCLCLYRDILFPNFYSRALCGMLIKEKRNREATINQNFYRKLLLSCLLSPHHFFLRTWNLRKMVFLVLFHISSPPVISGDETLQQCPLQNLYLDFWISEDFVLRLVTGKWERIVKFMLFGAGHKFLR